MKALFISGLLVLVVGAQARAGLTYTAVTTGEGRRAELQSMTIKASLDGDKARFDVTESKNPVMKAGSYLLTKDGSKTFFLVNPEKKTFATWDMQTTAGAAGDLGKMGKGMKTMTFSNFKTEKVLDEEGPALHGYATRHCKFKDSYTMELSILGMKDTTTVVREEEIWTAPKLADPGLMAWKRQQEFKTGDAELDKTIEAGRQKVEGFPLKKIVTSTTTSNRAQPQTTKTAMEVTEIKQAKLSGSLFEIPPGYKQGKLDMLDGIRQGLDGSEHPKGDGGIVNPLIKALQTK